MQTTTDKMFDLILQEEKATTQTEVDIIHLKKIILGIKPYSKWWRWGYVGSLRRAVKALERQGKNCSGRGKRCENHD